jgi:hypothetical protein
MWTYNFLMLYQQGVQPFLMLKIPEGETGSKNTKVSPIKTTPTSAQYFDRSK